MKKLNLMILSFALASPLSALASDNGSGYNGPDLNPASIPVQIERGISLEAIQDAIYVCMNEGDENAGLQSMMQKLAEQMNATPSAFPSYRNFDHDRQGMVGIRQLSGGWLFKDGHGQMNVSQYVTGAQGRWTSQLSISFGSGPLIGLGFYAPRDIVFPFVAYDKILEDGQYDDFGEIILSTRIVSGLRIEYSLPEGVNLAKVPLINDRTNVQTRFTVNAEEYIQCMQSELQKRAK